MHSIREVAGAHPARRTLAVAAAAGLGLSTLAITSPAAAAVPTFPDNIVVFPDRDFVSVEGYTGHAGETALLQVTRPGVGVMGSAKVVISGTDVAFEVNHPGGYCWGAGTSLQVTPDIVGGDIVSLTLADGTHDETITSSMTASDMVQNGTTVTVAGSYGADVEFPTQMEQRIINADLTGRGRQARCPGSAGADRAGGDRWLQLRARDRHRRAHVPRDLRVRHARSRSGHRSVGPRRAGHVLAGRGRRRQPAGPHDRRVR